MDIDYRYLLSNNLVFRRIIAVIFTFREESVRTGCISECFTSCEYIWFILWDFLVIHYKSISGYWFWYIWMCIFIVWALLEIDKLLKKDSTWSVTSHFLHEARSSIYYYLRTYSGQENPPERGNYFLFVNVRFNLNFLWIFLLRGKCILF